MAEGEKRRTKKKKKSELGGYGVPFFPLLFSSLLLAPRPNTHGLEKGGRKIEKIAQSGNREGGRRGVRKIAPSTFPICIFSCSPGEGGPASSASLPLTHPFRPFSLPRKKRGSLRGKSFSLQLFSKGRRRRGREGPLSLSFPSSWPNLSLPSPLDPTKKRRGEGEAHFLKASSRWRQKI